MLTRRLFCEQPGLKYSEKAMGYDKETWFELHEKLEPTEGQKMHETLKSVGLGEAWAGPEPEAPPEPEPEVHFAGKKWERMIAQHYGLLPPSQVDHQSIRESVARFADVTHQSDPKDACKYLAIEEHRCLLAAHADKQPEHAATKCLKWFEEWKQCAWDQHKFNEGITFIEGPELKKAYLFAPNHKYA